MKKLISATVVILLASIGTTTAQSGPFVAATVSYNSYLSVEAPNGNNIYYSGAEVATPSWTDKTLMVGFEGGVYASEALRILAGGGFNRTVAPGHDVYPGNAAAGIPSYDQTPSKASTNYTVFLGGDFCLGSKNTKPFVGVRARGAYGNNQMKYKYSYDSKGNSVAETWTVGGAIVVGADYTFQGGLILGCQCDLFSYTYGAVRYKPQPGLATNAAHCNNFGVFAAPTIRIGFNF
ncbi:MAG: hypothetical protein J6U13_00990 [Salinivirgaceae bacterium]|jgi:hypothetical protein|nr:hypothetical protein [Salinivirgaceae bacterium]